MAIDRNKVFIVWGKQCLDVVKRSVSPKDTVLVGPQRLSDWPFGVLVTHPKGQKRVVGPTRAQINHLKQLCEGLARRIEAVFVYPPGLNTEALVLRLRNSLKLETAKVASLERLRLEGVRRAINRAYHVNLAAAVFQEARLSLQKQSETVSEKLSKELDMDFPFSTTMSPVLHGLCHYREIHQSPEEKRNVALKIECLPLKEGHDDLSKYGLVLGTLKSQFFPGEGSLVLRESETKRLLSFLEINDRFFETTAQVKGDKLFTITAIENETEPFDILGLAAAAQKKANLSIAETLYWLEYLFVEGRINWPFENLDLQSIPVYSSDTGITDMAFRPRVQGPSIKVINRKDLKSLAEPSRELLNLILKRPAPFFQNGSNDPEPRGTDPLDDDYQDQGSQGKRAKGRKAHGAQTLDAQALDAQALGPLREVIDYTLKSQKGYQTIQVALSTEQVNKINSQPIRWLTDNLKKVSYDSFWKSAYDPSVFAIARELSSKGISSLKSVNQAVIKLEKRKCLKESGSHLRATKRGRVFDKLLSSLSLANPEFLRQTELALYRLSHLTGGYLDVQEELIEIFSKTQDECQKMLADKVYLKNMFSMFDNPKGAPDPSTRRLNPEIA
ncbi:MAG: hypothetical protein LBF38_11970 [Deltaproteobacteria bacterium]|jgi:hypothetical protein|nr:hypothetical protein [Deltaproteobacteria bacterium]